MWKLLVCNHTYLVNASFDNFWAEVRNLFEVRILAPHGLCNLNEDKSDSTYHSGGLYKHIPNRIKRQFSIPILVSTNYIDTKLDLLRFNVEGKIIGRRVGRKCSSACTNYEFCLKSCVSILLTQMVVMFQSGLFKIASQTH